MFGCLFGEILGELAELNWATREKSLVLLSAGTELKIIIMEANLVEVNHNDMKG